MSHAGPSAAPEKDAVTAASAVTVTLGRGRVSIKAAPGETLLACARRAGLAPPSICERGVCGACIAKLDEGQVIMRVNNVLSPQEVAEGWVLTCQAVPDSQVVAVRYE